MPEGESVPPDPSMTVREWLRKNAEARQGKPLSDRRATNLGRTIPHVLLGQPATVQQCVTVNWILGKMSDQLKRDMENDRGVIPEALDMSPYEDCNTVGDVIQQYISQHAPEAAVKVKRVLKREFRETWEFELGEQEKRRWVFVFRLTCPPEMLRNRFERARLIKGLPGRN